MSYRRHVDRKRAVAEKAWIDRHRSTLRQMGLPPVVYLDYAHWSDFLDNGCLDHHPDPTNYYFGQLTRDQMTALLAFLEVEYHDTEKAPAMLGWLRHRLQSPS